MVAEMIFNMEIGILDYLLYIGVTGQAI